jgi:hypothetical protein
MAIAGIQLTAEITELRALQEAIGRIFTPQEKANILKSALTKAIEPVFSRLKDVTPIGPTGNLRRAVAKKIIRYASDGNAVALVGFRRAGLGGSSSAAGGSVRAGSDRAFHQWWLEEGTQPRFVANISNKPYGRRGHLRRLPGRPAVDVRPHIVQKGQGGYIASSYNRLGPFKKVPTARDSGRIQTDPGYPNAFFKKSKTPITIPAMQPGGSGAPPLKTAWAQTQGIAAEILQRELRITLEQAISVLARSSTGTIGE